MLSYFLVYNVKDAINALVEMVGLAAAVFSLFLL